MAQESKYLQWLKNNKQFFSIDKIEKELQMPFTTIQQWIAGNRDLPEKWKEPLTEWIKQFRKL